MGEIALLLLGTVVGVVIAVAVVGVGILWLVAKFLGDRPLGG